MIKTRKQALCQHLGFCTSEIDEYRYHYGKTSISVYAIDNTYYCATKGTQKPATHINGLDWNWQEEKNEFVNQFGWRIWKDIN